MHKPTIADNIKVPMDVPTATTIGTPVSKLSGIHISIPHFVFGINVAAVSFRSCC